MQRIRAIGAAGQMHRGGVSGIVPENLQTDTTSERAASYDWAELALGRLIHGGAFSSRPEIAQSRSVALILRLRAEVRHVSVLTGICTSAANALSNDPNLHAVRALIRFYPVGSSSYILAVTRYHRLDPGSGLARALNAFTDALDTAMNATMVFIADHQAARDPTSIATVEFCAAWRFACGQAHCVLAEIDKAIGIFNPVDSAVEDDVLTTVLKEAAGGGSPLRAPDGEFIMPAWAERRQLPRISTACCARLHVGTRVNAIRIIDVSIGGLGIETSVHLREDDIVTIEVKGIVLPGRVVWCRQERAGIAFEQSLLDESPEFRFLASYAEPD